MTLDAEPFTPALLLRTAIRVIRANLFPFFFLASLGPALVLALVLLWPPPAIPSLRETVARIEDADRLDRLHQILEMQAGNATLAARYWLFSRSLSWFLGLLVGAAICHGATRHLAGRPAPLGACLKRAVVLLPSLIAIGLVTGLPNLLGRLLPVLGSSLTPIQVLLFFNIPGFVLHVLFFLAIPVAVVESPAVLRSLARSLLLAKGGFSSIFLCSGGLSIAFFLISLLLSQSLSEGAYRSIAGALLGIPLSLIWATLPGVAYVLLRERKEGVSVANLARTFT